MTGGWPHRRTAGYAAGVLILALVLTGCGEGPSEPPAPERPVKLVTVSERDTLIERRFSGRTQAAERAWLAFRVGGVVESVAVERGERVDEGDLLARLDPRDFQRRVRELEGGLVEARAEQLMLERGAREEERRQLEARLEAAGAREEQAESEYRRVARMRDDGHVSQSEYDRARRALREAAADRRSAQEALTIARAGGREEEREAARGRIRRIEAQLEQARDALEDSELRAPFTGYVAERDLERHEPVQAHHPVVLFEDLESIEIEVGIPEGLLAWRDRLEAVEVRIPALDDARFCASIRSVGVDVLPGRQTYPVKVRLETPDPLTLPATALDPDRVLPGMTAEVAFRARPEPGVGVVLPPSALVEHAEGYAVWVRDPEDGRVAPRQVEVLGADGRGVRVQGDLEPGDEVVSAGAGRLREGQRTRRFNDEAPASGRDTGAGGNRS